METSSFLFGEGDAYERALDERCPLRDADMIETPIIFFQGLEDPAVPPEQTERMYEALLARGVSLSPPDGLEAETRVAEALLRGFRERPQIARVILLESIRGGPWVDRFRVASRRRRLLPDGERRRHGRRRQPCVATGWMRRSPNCGRPARPGWPTN